MEERPVGGVMAARAGQLSVCDLEADVGPLDPLGRLGQRAPFGLVARPTGDHGIPPLDRHWDSAERGRGRDDGGVNICALPVRGGR